jgi:DNA-binding XRE family transcriptional regulator
MAEIKIGGKRARVVPYEQRKPLYAAYEAARQECERLGETCSDDRIILAAIKAYERERRNQPPLVLRQLTSLRRRCDISQAEIAGELGTTQSAISEMESGLVSPTLATLSKYAALFGMEIILAAAESDKAGPND